MSTPSSKAARTPTSRVRHSREQIVDAAIAMLDRDGVRGLTLRGLAAELGGGLGSIYWYVSGKDELIDLAVDELTARALQGADRDLQRAVEGEADQETEAPPRQVDLRGATAEQREAVEQIRRVALALFAQMEQHPWMAAQTQLGDERRPHGLQVWERLGRPLAAMGLTPRRQFYGSTALGGYVVGVAAEMAAQEQSAEPGLSQAEQLERIAQRWAGEAYDDLPWIRSMAQEFRTHDDRAQFAAGLDLLLSGLVRQAVEPGDPVDAGDAGDTVRGR